uniref:Uncharacterized protein n=1 Tax=viral metagenome TaxID=1070528 RepID=A0A6C0HVP2_9ZZZZ
MVEDRWTLEQKLNAMRQKETEKQRQIETTNAAARERIMTNVKNGTSAFSPYVRVTSKKGGRRRTRNTSGKKSKKSKKSSHKRHKKSRQISRRRRV